jgi:succinylglutamate desuccinylase
VIGRLGSPTDGPTLICLGGVHGNEPAGEKGLERVVAELERRGALLRGEFIALAGNRGAIAQGTRWVDEDLNRMWLRTEVDRLNDGAPTVTSEEVELLELEAEIDAALRRAEQDVWFLDLHTTSGEGPPFGVLDDTLPNREFAQIFDIPIVVGLEEELDGTVLSYYVSKGLRTFGLECGQHDDPASIDRAEAAIWLALVGVGLIPERDAPDLDAKRRVLRQGTGLMPRVVEVRHRHPVDETDEFRMRPGFLSFQPVKGGETLAQDRHGEVQAPYDGILLMPLYQTQGEDGFFIVRPVRQVWLKMSAVLRHVNAEHFLHWLPGVRRAGDGPDSFIVDRRVARWFALEILHLLGFRRHGVHGDDLLVSRRPNDD